MRSIYLISMKQFSNKKLLNYCLALIPGVLALGTTPQALAIDISATGAGFTIPDNDPAGVFSDVTFTDDLIIDDVTVTLTDLNHTWAGDLTATLTNLGTGTSVDLFSRPGSIDGSGFGNNTDLEGNFSFNDSFADDFVATTAANVGGIVSGGDFFATTLDDTQTFLSAFNGESSANTFRLTISDNAGGDTGDLGSFTLDISGTAAPATAVPFEFSPTLGLVLLGGGIGLKKSRDRRLKQKSEVDLS